MPSIVPEWAPNLHPLVVHFPISLLVAAALVDLAGLFWRTSRGLRLSAVLLYGAGALGALAAYITGTRAADTVEVPTEAISTLNTHQDLALYTLIFFGVYAGIRVALFLMKRELAVTLHVLVVLVGIGGQVLVWQTGEHGGELVFEHGIGVGAVDRVSGELEELSRRLASAQAAPEELEGGGFRWTIGPGAEEALGEAFTFIEGAPEELEASVEEDEGGYVLTLDVERGPILLVAGDDLASVDAEAEVDLSDFAGTVALVHNVQGPEAYHYLRLGNEAVLGRLAGSEDEPMGSSDVQPSGWATLRATGDQGHFYGYVDGATIAHGHGDVPAAGPAGLRFEGNGTVRLRRLEAQAVQ